MSDTRCAPPRRGGRRRAASPGWCRISRACAPPTWRAPWRRGSVRCCAWTGSRRGPTCRAGPRRSSPPSTGGAIWPRSDGGRGSTRSRLARCGHRSSGTWEITECCSTRRSCGTDGHDGRRMRMTGMILAESLKRRGTESAFAVLARAGALAAGGRDIINLGIGQPDFRTPEHVVEAGIKALRDGHHGYTPANGLPALREAVAADLHRRHGVEVNPDNVVVVPGGKPTMFFAVLMFGQPGVEILYPDPGFPIYESVIRYSGATPVPIPLNEADGFAFSADAVLGRITPQTRLIIINSPANPTGGVTPRAEIDRLVAGLADHPHVAVLSDEIYSQMLYGGRAHVSLLQYPEIRDRLIMLDEIGRAHV